MLPPSTGSVMVSYNNRNMNYGTDYTLNINNKTITISTQTVTGVAGVTIVGVGGAEFATSDAITVTNTASITLSNGIPNLVNIGSVYATLNGTALTASQYTLTNKGFTVSNLDPTQTYTLQVWFFEAAYKGYSEVKEQQISTYERVYDYTLTQYPGNLGPNNSQAIVELDKRRLTPPHTAYYSAVASQTFYDIDPSNDYPAGIYDLLTIQVFVNGIKIRNGIDFLLDQPNNRIEFTLGFLKTGDALAITNTLYSDYYFEINNINGIPTGQIHISNNISPQNGGLLKVITYTNQDSDMIRNEVYLSSLSRRYTMNRRILNDDYVWVSIGGNPLINGLDYRIDLDRKTVIIDDSYPYNAEDKVLIMSMTDVADTTVIGYRVFKDLLGRTTFKRLSAANSTRLSAPLYTTSTIINVVDASRLPTPNLINHRPGIILIAGERIEYMSINVSTNTISNIKRATLGTGAHSEYPTGTEVIDQSAKQNIPYKETTILMTTATDKLLSSSYEITGDITTSFANTTTNFQDLVTVYYGGIPLRKDGIYVQRTSVMYDNIVCNISTITVSTSTMLPITKVLNTAYIVTATNQVWIYLDSNEVGAVNGYVYRGLDYYPPQYTITTSTTSNVYLLNLAIDKLTEYTEIKLKQTIAKPVVSGIPSFYTNTKTSLLNDSGAVATFLRDSKATLPDKYHYGQL